MHTCAWSFRDQKLMQLSIFPLCDILVFERVSHWIWSFTIQPRLTSWEILCSQPLAPELQCTYYDKWFFSGLHTGAEVLSLNEPPSQPFSFLIHDTWLTFRSICYDNSKCIAVHLFSFTEGIPHKALEALGKEESCVWALWLEYGNCPPSINGL